MSEALEEEMDHILSSYGIALDLVYSEVGRVCQADRGDLASDLADCARRRLTDRG